MLMRIAKFGIAAAFAVSAGSYLLRGGVGPDIQIDTRNTHTVVAPQGVVVPGNDGTDYDISGIDPRNAPKVEVDPTLPSSRPLTDEDEPKDPVLSNAQLNGLRQCFRASDHRLKAVRGEEAYYEGFKQLARLLVQDQYMIPRGILVVNCDKTVTPYVNQVATVGEGKCRTLTLSFTAKDYERNVAIQFCRDPETKDMIIGPAGVTLTRSP